MKLDELLKEARERGFTITEHRYSEVLNTLWVKGERRWVMAHSRGEWFTPTQAKIHATRVRR